MLLDSKVLAVLGYCHERLIEAKEQDDKGNARTFLKNQEDEIFLNEISHELIAFCENIRATKRGLAERLGNPLFKNIKIFYEACCDHYCHNVKIGEAHIPIIYCLEVFRILSSNKMISFDLRKLERALLILEECEEFNTKMKPSRFDPNKMVVDRSEFNKYLLMSADILEVLWKAEKLIKQKQKKSKRTKPCKR